MTGVVFAGESLREIGAGVLVPTQLYKALYDPATGQAGAYLVPNAAGREWKSLSLDELRTVTGVDVFPRPAARRQGERDDTAGSAIRRARRGAAPGRVAGPGLARLALARDDAGVRKAIRELLREIF